jgi:hypothetical protein
MVHSAYVNLAAAAENQSILPPALQTNGCGSTFSSRFVRDSIADCDFKNACKKHDVCYGKCLDGGELSRTARCNDPKNVKESRREQCDQALEADIIEDNKGD